MKSRSSIKEQLQVLRSTKTQLHFREPIDVLKWKIFEDGICTACGLPLANIPDDTYESDEELIQCDRDWINSDSQDNLFTFRSLCNHFNIDYKNIRRTINEVSSK